MSLQFVDVVQAQALVRADVAAELGEIVGDPATALRLAVLRRAAARMCPASRTRLVAGAATALQGLIDEYDALVEQLQEDVEALVVSGDLIPQSGQRNTLDLSPPLFVRRSSGRIFLVGGRPSAAVSFGQALLTRGAFRELREAVSDEDLSARGFSPFPIEAWMESPRAEAPEDLISRLKQVLDRSGPAGDLEGLMILVPDAGRDYYAGRWLAPGRRSGHFVGRRSRRWGRPAWCFVQLSDGVPTKVVDLPMIDPRFRGCDEAWWLVCATDAIAGDPQRARISKVGDRVRIALSMPLPMWAERRLRLVGEPAEDRPAGSLVAFDLLPNEVEEEVRFLERLLWMRMEDVTGP
jgi:hypothetical protein